VPGLLVPFERKTGDKSASLNSRASASRPPISRWLRIVSPSAERSTPLNVGLRSSLSQPVSSTPDAPAAMKRRREIMFRSVPAAPGNAR
jgi:hypothetical protein